MLGRMWPEPAGEFGVLELGELLWEELPPGIHKHKSQYASVNERHTQVICLSKVEINSPT